MNIMITKQILKIYSWYFAGFSIEENIESRTELNKHILESDPNFYNTNNTTIKFLKKHKVKT